LLPLSPRSDPDSKPTSLLQLVNNWPPSELSAPLIRRHTRFCARYTCFTLHYITLHELHGSDQYWIHHNVLRRSRLRWFGHVERKDIVTIAIQYLEVLTMREQEIEALGRLVISVWLNWVVWRKTWLNWVCTENGLWIELVGEVSYAETVQPVQTWRTDIKRG